MVKENLTSLQKKITKVANSKKYSSKEMERKLISLYKLRAKLIANRRKK